MIRLPPGPRPKGRHEFLLEAREGTGLARGGHAVLHFLLAAAAQRGERQGLQPGLGDLRLALGAEPIAAVLQAEDRLVDLGQRLRLHLHEGEIDLLDEIVDDLLLGVPDFARFHAQGLPERPQLLLDLQPPLLEHSLEDPVTLVIHDRRLLPSHGIPPSLVRLRPAEAHAHFANFSTTIRKPSLACTRSRAAPSRRARSISRSKSWTPETAIPFTLTIRSPRWRPASSAGSPASTSHTRAPFVPRGSSSLSARALVRSRSVIPSLPFCPLAVSSSLVASGKVPRVTEMAFCWPLLRTSSFTVFPGACDEM